MVKNKKRGFLQISFGWLFAIIAGLFILFLGIYISVKIVNVGEYSLNTETAKQIGVLLNPLETGFETGKTTFLALPTETRFYNECDDYGNFGAQSIRISQKSFNKWPTPAAPVSFSNKYIFSEEIVEGKKFYIFSKPFEFPFKTSDLIYLTSALDSYCFIDAPEDIEEEVYDLNQENLYTEDCPEKSIKICFESKSGCDIDVNYNSKYVEKRNKKMYFEEDALMYAAIFSNKDIYECQLKRLMKRVENLATIYKDKAAFVSQKGCNSNLNLLGLINAANNLKDSKDLVLVSYIAKDIKEKNEDYAVCRLW